jgi:hypothetical protein
MAIQGRTREQLRQAVGRRLGLEFFSSFASSNSTGSTDLVDNTLFGGDDTYNGWYILFTSGTNDGAVRRITDFTDSTGKMDFTRALSATPQANDTFELWEEKISPDMIHEFMNEAIIQVTNRFFDPVESVALFADGFTRRYDTPDNISVINSLQRRVKVPSKTIHECATTWDEATDADFTQTVDTEFTKQGGKSLKVVIAAAASAGDHISDSISSVDLSAMTHLEFWIYSTVGTSAGNYKIHLDNAAVQADGTDLESELQVPALAADTWTFVRIPLNNPELDTAIVSVGFEYDSDIGAVTVYMDDFKAVNEDRSEWAEIPRHMWSVDPNARDIIMDYPRAVGYALLKIVGGDKPALFSSDTSVTEVPDQWVISKTIEMMHVAMGADPIKINLARSDANRARSAMPMLVNARRAE